MTDIRQVRPEDAAGIAEIYNGYVTGGVQSFETEPLSCAMMNDRITATASRHPYFVAEEEGRVTGFCYAHPWKERAAYSHTLETTIYLHPDFKRRGTGTALMKRLIEECRHRGYKALIACITGDNEASIAFHASLGFRQVSLFRNVGYKHGRWLDVTDMELLL